MNIASIIKYEGPNNVFVWKHPIEDFNTNSQLIVAQTQKAAIFYNGQLCDIFDAGKHTLETQNLPFLRQLINIGTNGETPFTCQVYFVNLVDSLNNTWGTPQPIQVKDPNFDIILPVGANGQFGLRVIDVRNLLLKLVGTIQSFDQNTVIDYFKGLLLMNIKQSLSQILVDNKVSILDVNSHLSEISSSIEQVLDKEFGVYGFDVVNFCVSSIVVPEDNPSYVELKKALAEKAKYNVLGTNYQQDRTFDILETAAGNEGGGSQVMGAGLGLGMGVNMGGMFGGAMAGAMQNVSGVDLNSADNSNNSIEFCSKCGNKLQEGAVYCSKCGEKVYGE
jgi:membrane protease subunit (stomatin/prohibitin family)